MGYIICVGTDFIERVERSLLCGQVPEQQMKCLKKNTSHDNPVLGYVVEVVYKISMPVIVKAEPRDDDDDDLILLGVSPGIPINPAHTIDVKVKTEKTEDNKDETKSQSQISNPVSGNKAAMTQETQSPVNESDSDKEGSIDVVNSSQGSKRSTETPEKKPAQKKRKKNPAPVVLPPRELRSRTNKDGQR